MPTGMLQIRAISAHSGGVPGRGVQREEEVCKYIDTTTCIGCKACEVACVEWNDLHLEPEYGQRMLHSYQTMADMTPSYWNLIKFDEIPVDSERRPLEPPGGIAFLPSAFATGEVA